MKRIIKTIDYKLYELNKKHPFTKIIFIIVLSIVLSITILVIFFLYAKWDARQFDLDINISTPQLENDIDVNNFNKPVQADTINKIVDDATINNITNSLNQ